MTCCNTKRSSAKGIPMSNHRNLEGTTLDGRFRLGKAIGAGGMGVVYRARDEEGAFGDIVVKIPKDLGDADLVARFEREAQRHAAISHPSVVPVLHIGRHERLPYLVMPYLAGGSLADRLQGGVQSAHEVCGWLGEVARALDALHAAEALHRDVKPSNVLFDGSGRAQLADFGISKGGDTTTIGGGPRGSLNFMPPEATEGRYEPPYDQYGLAATAYFALTGRYPGDDNKDDAKDGHTEWRRFWRRKRGRVCPPHELHPRVDEAVSDALLQGLRLNPEFRYPNCQALADALAAVAGNEPAGASPARDPDVTVMSTLPARDVPTSAPVPFEPPAMSASRPALSDDGTSDPTGPQPVVDPESFAEGCFEVLLDDQPAKHAAVPVAAADDTRQWGALPPPRPKRRIAPWLAGSLAAALALALFVLWPRDDAREPVPLAVQDVRPGTGEPIEHNKRSFHVSVDGRGDLTFAQLQVGSRTEALAISRAEDSWSAFGSIDVDDGQHVVQLELKSETVRTLRKWSVFVDATPPAIRLTRKAQIADGHARFSVAVDEANPQSVVDLRVERGACERADDGEYLCDVPLGAGDDVLVRVASTDRLGNEGTLDVSLRAAPAAAPPKDATPPRFYGHPKRTQYVRSAGRVILRGRIDDPRAVVVPQIRGRGVVGRPGTVDASGRFSVQVDVPEQSSYEVHLVARDASGNEATQRHHVIVDGERPRASVLQPRDGTVLTAGKATPALINVIDQWPDRVRVRVYRGKDLVESFEATVRATRGRMPPTTIEFPLPGTYRIEVVAHDRAGNVSEVTRHTVEVR